MDVRGFSKGITDNIESQDPKEMMKADNLVIDYPSEDLVGRQGSVVHNETTPRITEQRVSRLVNFNKDDVLLAISEGKIFFETPENGILETLGPEGHSAFPGQTSNMVPSCAEHRGHMYIATDDDDADGVKPVKLYKDETGEVTLVTAGLPKFEHEDAYTAATAGASIAAMAVDIRDKFLKHYANTTVTAHAATPGAAATPDTVAAALITLTDVAAGDDLATTIAKVAQYMNAYRSHYTDAVKPNNSRVYHTNHYDLPGTPNVLLERSEAPETFLEVAQVLNNLKKCHNWHVRGFKGHFTAAALDANGLPTPTVTAAHQVTVADLANTEEGPIFSDVSYAKLIASANEAKSKYNAHIGDAQAPVSVGNAGSHITTSAHRGILDSENSISLANASDKNSAYELVAHLWAAYWFHHQDAMFQVYRIVGTGDHAAADRKYIENAYVSVPAQGSGLSPLKVGMWLDFRNDTGTGPSWTPVSGLKIGEVDTTNNRIKVVDNAGADVDNDASGADDGTVDFVQASFMKYHKGKPLDGTSGELEEFEFAAFDRDLEDVVTALLDMIEKFNAHDGNYGQAGTVNFSFPHPSALNHQIAESFTELVVSRYLYAFAFSREYTVETGEVFKDVSATYLKSKVALAKIEESPTAITGLPAVVNGATDNYDVANIEIEVYRSVNGGIIPFLSGNVANGTDTYTDAVSDTEIEGKEQVYTTGGVVDNDPPPIAKTVHVHKGFGFYGNLKVGDEYFPNRLAQSIAEDVDSVPESFFVDLPNPHVGTSSTERNVVAWTTSGTYRIEGRFDERGQGEVDAIPISDTVGLRGGISPVQIDQGIVFAGPDGFYFTDAYKVQLISPQLPDTYAQIIATAARARRIDGVYDSENQRVLWACAFDGDENDSIFVLHLDFGLRPDGASFTVLNGGGSFRPSAICIFDDNLIRGDSRGYILRHTEDYNDPLIDTNLPADQWLTQPIVFDYRSPNFDFGTRKVKKFVTKITMFLAHVGKLTAQIFRINDQGKSTKELKKIQFSGVPMGAITEKRWMKFGNLRCMTCQARITNEVEGQDDEKIRISAFSLWFVPLGDTLKDAAADEAEVSSA